MASFSRAYSNMTMSMCLIFPPKTERDPCQRDTVAYFLTAPSVWFQGGTGPNSGLTCASFTVLCGRIPPDHFRVPDTSKDHSHGPRRLTTIFSAILHGELRRADDAQTLLQIWLSFYSMDFEKISSKFGSTTLFNSFGLHDSE